MPKKGHTEEEILAALHQVETGTEIADSLPEAGNQYSDVLPVAEKVLRTGAGVTKSEFERRAAEMRESNLEKPRLRTLPPPRYRSSLR